MIQGIINKTFNKIYSPHKKGKLLNHWFLPRWIVLAIDVVILCFSILITYFALISLNIRFYETFSIAVQFGLILTVNTFFFLLIKTYAGIIRHSTFTDISKLFLASLLTLVVITIINYSFYFVVDKKIYLMPGMVLYAFLSFSLLLLFRILVKNIYVFLRTNEATDIYKKRLVIYGTDNQAVSIAETIKADLANPFEVMGFVTKDKKKREIRILNKPVFDLESCVNGMVQEKRIHALLLIEGTLSIKQKNKLVDECLKSNLLIYNVPTFEKLHKTKTIENQIKVVDIEDLLGREEIFLEDDHIRSMLFEKTILVTGGAGSIGSEIVRQIIHYNPKRIVILDQAESQLHDLEIELSQSFPNANFVTELADIKNLYRLSYIFEHYKFDIVYHAAAYKHVPMIENNPHEAIYVNIIGTINLVKLAIANNVNRFVMVSTDKAVNPTNVMGASKRAAEIYIQSIQNEPKVNTNFIITRFGNVLGSNGSVIPHFKRQIAAGGPVMITHPDIIRYFMTISEASQLVLQAGTMGSGGEIFVFDMGKPIKIINLAKKLIRLSGLVPDEDIKIEISGLRPGEKLYEELLADSSINIPTHHPKIMAAKDPALPFKEVEKLFIELIKISNSGSDKDLVSVLKEIVAEFKSENSKYVSLDK